MNGPTVDANASKDTIKLVMNAFTAILMNFLNHYLKSVFLTVDLILTTFQPPGIVLVKKDSLESSISADCVKMVRSIMLL